MELWIREAMLFGSLVLTSNTGHLEKRAFSRGKKEVHKVNHLSTAVQFGFLSGRLDGIEESCEMR